MFGYSSAQEQDIKHVLRLTEGQSQHLRQSLEQYLAAKAAYQSTIDEIKAATPEASCSSDQIEVASDFTSVKFSKCEPATELPKAGYPLPTKTATSAQQHH